MSEVQERERRRIRGFVEDPENSVYATHRKETCGRCHENVDAAFARIPVHPLDSRARPPYAFWTKRIYTLLIVPVIGGMLVHNAIIFIFHVRNTFG